MLNAVIHLDEAGKIFMLIMQKTRTKVPTIPGWWHIYTSGYRSTCFVDIQAIMITICSISDGAISNKGWFYKIYAQLLPLARRPDALILGGNGFFFERE